MDMQDMNTTLSNKGYSKFSNNLFGIGFGGREINKSRYRKFIFNDSSAVFYLPREKNSTVGNKKYNSSLSGFAGVFNIGYVIYEKNNLKIFPLWGMGGGVMRMRITEKRSFDDTLDNPKGSAVITHGISILSLSVGIEKLFKKKEGEKVDRYRMVGIRLGYRHCPDEYDWKNVSGGPDITMTGPFFMLMYGGGSQNKNKSD
ncbi:hypothetical protein ACFL6H_04670 [Candidatus Latescibacterota bacterium]